MTGRELYATSLLALSGCSVLVQPDLNRLRGSDAAMTVDSSAVDDVVQPSDTSEPLDVPTPVDVPTGCVDRCDDGVSCTIDRCNNGTCVHSPDNTRCGADSRCDARVGCVPIMMMRCSGPGDCDDSNPCTADRCNGGRCEHAIVDADMDGAPARMVDGRDCGGTDCDDRNPLVHPRAMEVCDRIDNDCNGMIDELPGCMPAANSTCASAARIDLTSSSSATVSGDNSRGASTVQGYCGRAEVGAGGELWYQVTWPANRDLILETARGADAVDPMLFVTTSCGQPAIVCHDDISARERNARVIVRSEGPAPLGSRTVFVALDATSAASSGPVTLRARTQSAASANCGGPFVIEGGAAVRGATSVGSLTMTSCGGGGLGSLDVFRYRGASGSVRLFTSSGALGVRRDCNGPTICVTNGGAFNSDGDTFVVLERPMGSYVLTVYGP